MTRNLCHLFDRYLSSRGPDYEEVSVHGDQEDREGGEEDAGRLGGADQLAQDLLKKCPDQNNFLTPLFYTAVIKNKLKL